MDYYSIVSKKENINISNVPPECKECMKSSPVGISSTLSCPLNARRKRYVEKGNDDESLFYYCSDQEQCLGSNKIFKSKVAVIKDIIPIIVSDREKAKQEVTLQSKRIYHNVVSLNAHNIQELYALVSDKILSQKLDQQRRIIRETIENNIDSAVSLFLRIAKNNMAIQTNFNVFNKLSEPSPSMNYRRQKIQRVFLAVFHVFFQDFFDKDIDVQIEDTDLEFFIDYESISVAFYHILDNAAKYALKGSKIHIKFKEFSDYCAISFTMESIEIRDDEKAKILQEGVQGEAAKKMETKGHGIGMYIVDQLLKLNNGKIVINSDLDDRKKHFDGLPYRKNEFVLMLPIYLHKPLKR